MIPVLNHPHGIHIMTMLQAVHSEKKGRCVIFNECVHWYNFVTPQDRDNGHHDPRRLKWMARQSGYAGPRVMQLKERR
jgi:hypothetical protein